MGDADLTPEHFSRWLGHDVAAIAATPIGDGLVGMNLRVQLTYAGATPDGAPATVVVKLPSPDPTSRATGIALRNYEREVLFYAHIAHTVDIRVATCHHGEWDPDSGDFVLVLEDLGPARQGDQITGCGVEHARRAVHELARLHGPRWADPTLHDVEWLTRRVDGESAEQLGAMYGLFMPGFLATYAKYLDADGIALVEAFSPRVVDWVVGDDSPLTVTHGDYRLDNLMFGTDDGGPSIAAVDWQTPGHGPALNDVSYFLGAGPLPDERRAIEHELVAEYVDGLAAYGVAISQDWAFDRYRRAAFGGVIMSVVASQIVQVTERSEPMFAAMATRHVRHALDLDSMSAI
jgi:aminoglycoside/choline kinase family phosphotransferase